MASSSLPEALKAESSKLQALGHLGETFSCFLGHLLGRGKALGPFSWQSVGSRFEAGRTFSPKRHRLFRLDRSPSPKPNNSGLRIWGFC